MRTSMKIIPLLVLFAVAAWAQKVHYNYDRSADFAAYRTYNWVTMPSATAVDQLTDQDIRRAIEEQLAEKGLVRVEENPDLLVGYQLTVREQQQIETWGDVSPWGWGPAWGGWWGPGWATTTITTVPIGTIVVDMYDPARHQLVWRGVETRTLTFSDNPEKNYKKIQKGMAKLFKHYPPEEKG